MDAVFQGWEEPITEKKMNLDIYLWTKLYNISYTASESALVFSFPQEKQFNIMYKKLWFISLMQ